MKSTHAMIAAALLISPTIFGQDTPDTQSFFERFAEHRNVIRQLDARFEQETVTPDEVFESSGTIVYARVGDSTDGIEGKRLLFRYDDPPLSYMIDGLQAYEYDPELKQLQIFTLADRPEAEAFYLGFDSNTARLAEAYEIRVQPPAEINPGGMAVTLIPKDPESEEVFFQRVTLQLRAGDLLPTHIHIVNDAESEVRYRIEDVSVSAELDRERATLLVPEGVSIVEEDLYGGDVPEGGLRFPLGSNAPLPVDAEPVEE